MLNKSSSYTVSTDFFFVCLCVLCSLLLLFFMFAHTNYSEAYFMDIGFFFKCNGCGVLDIEGAFDGELVLKISETPRAVVLKLF